MGGRSGQSIGGGIAYGTNKAENIRLTIEWGKKNGIKIVSEHISGNVHAMASNSNQTIYINKSSSYWSNPVERMKAAYESGFLSTSNPIHTVIHETGHLKYKDAGQYWRSKDYQRGIAGQVSRYAQTNPSEFVAETHAGLKSGKKYSKEVMQLFGLYAKTDSRFKANF